MYSDVLITLSVRLSHGLRVHLLGLEQCLQLSVLIFHLSLLKFLSALYLHREFSISLSVT